jgi:hypothetical protein
MAHGRGSASAASRAAIARVDEVVTCQECSAQFRARQWHGACLAFTRRNHARLTETTTTTAHHDPTAPRCPPARGSRRRAFGILPREDLHRLGRGTLWPAIAAERRDCEVNCALMRRACIAKVALVRSGLRGQGSRLRDFNDLRCAHVWHTGCNTKKLWKRRRRRIRSRQPSPRRTRP